MSFLHPEFLYYMLPPLFILFGLLLTQKESVANFFSKEVMYKLRVSVNTLTLKTRNILFLFVGFLMIIALAQPVINEGKVEIRAKSSDIMIAIDISDSMLASDIYPNRLESAKQKALVLLDEAQNERIGIVAFAKNSYLVSPLSFDTSAVTFLLTQLNTSSITEKGTDFLSLLDVVSKIKENQDKKYLLIISDGGDKSDFKDEIAFAKKNNIVVFVLGIATKNGSPIKLQDGTFVKYNTEIIISKLNEKIADLATNTGGVYIESTTSLNDIKTMLKEIKNISERKELKSQEIQKYIPLFYYPLGVALMILLIAISSMGARKKVDYAPLFLFFFLTNTDAEAGMLDFLELKNAKEAYGKGEFEKSAKYYEKYANENKNGESYYNAGNSHYKQKKYKEAIASYKKATFDNEDARVKNFSNLGNAYAKDGDLQKAIESYEKSLEIKEDKETRENLQTVEKLLEKQKQNPKDGEQNSKDEKEEKNSGKKEKQKDENDISKGKESQNKEKSSDDVKNKKDEKQNEKPSKESKIKQDDKKDEKSSKNLHEKMSDAEERKWVEQLKSGNNSYLYKLNNEKINRSDFYEKPW